MTHSSYQSQAQSQAASRREKKADRARMLISCPDRSGIVAAVSQFLYEQGANIVQSDQYSMDPEGGMFFMRLEFDLPNLEQRIAALQEDFTRVADRFQMRWSVYRAARRKRIAVFVSKEDHCLLELLWQWQAGDLDAEISMVISNHPDMRELVESFGIPYHHIPVTPETKPEAERKQLELTKGKVDLIVLARYMQILSGRFIEEFPNRIINIHHSFLPAFVGSKPYQQAYVQRVSHRENVSDLKRIGRHIERIVLARAVKWHIEDRILVHKNKTVVFV